MNKMIGAILTAIVLLLNVSSVRADVAVVEMNRIRKEYGLSTLTVNYKLNESAKNKACDLKINKYWDHISPTGKTPWEFFDEAGYYYEYAGENLARKCDPATCIKWFMKSKTHRENILRPEYTEVGVGYCYEFTVVHFGRR